MDQDENGSGSVYRVDQPILSSVGGRESCSENGQESRYSTSGYGRTEQTEQSNRHANLSQTGEEQHDGRMVETDGAREFRPLDQQMLIDHSLSGGEMVQLVDQFRELTSLTGGCGCSESQEVETNKTRCGVGEQYLIYWLWRCRQNPADEEPKPRIIV